MGKKVFVYDPTTSDKLSSVRGIGRYLQILKENFENEFEFVNNETMKQLNNDCVFINPFYNFLQRPLTLKRIANKQIAIIHDLIPLKYPSHYPAGIKGSIYILLNKLTLRNYDLIITDSEASKLDIINILKIKSEKLRVIYPCLPKVFMDSGVANAPQNDVILASELSERVQNLPKKFCVYVGDATWNKNLVNLAKAIKIADVPIIFVGKVFEKKYQRSNIKGQNDILKIKNNNETIEQLDNDSLLNHPWNLELKQFFKETINDKRFIFPGFIADNELIKLYKQSFINILPSRDEGFGFSYVESAQFGCPSLLSDISVLREISDGKAIFFDENNPKDIAEKIKMIYSNKDLRNKIGIDAKKRSEFFSPEKFKREFLSVIPA